MSKTLLTAFRPLAAGSNDTANPTHLQKLIIQFTCPEKKTSLLNEQTLWNNERSLAEEIAQG